MQQVVRFSIIGVICLVASSLLLTATEAAPPLVLKDVINISFEQQKKESVNIDNRLGENKQTDMKSMDDSIKLLSRALSSKFNRKAQFDGLERWIFDEKSSMNIHTDMKQYLDTKDLDDPIQLLSAALSPKFNEKAKFEDDKKRWAELKDLIEKPEPELEKELPVFLPYTSDAPDVCKDGSLDTAIRTANGITYLFKGNFYWKILNDGIADGYPRKIADDWDGLEGNLDASLTWSNRRTYFFKGKRYWRFTNEKMDPGYPKLISQGFKGIPDNLDAAVVWSGNGATYFFKGDKYWRYNSNSDTPVNSDYPYPITFWKGLPNNSIDAAIQWENHKTYFFKGGKYYKYNDEEDKVESPQLTSIMWFGCEPEPSNQSEPTLQYDNI